MKKKTLLDSYALLAYLKKEDNYMRVKDLLSSGSTAIIMNEMNIGEAYYIIARRMGVEKAEYFLNAVLPSLPITVISNDGLKGVIEASRLKAKYAISYMDCFASPRL